MTEAFISGDWQFAFHPHITSLLPVKVNEYFGSLSTQPVQSRQFCFCFGLNDYPVADAMPDSPEINVLFRQIQELAHHSEGFEVANKSDTDPAFSRRRKRLCSGRFPEEKQLFSSFSSFPAVKKRRTGVYYWMNSKFQTET